MNQEIFVLGVAGGSGSGKTYFAKDLVQRMGLEISTLVYQDNYYLDQSGRFDHDGGSVNFDHPSALDFSLLADSLRQLKQGQNIQMPIYDFATHTRSEQSILVRPKRLVIVDGILILHSKEVREVLDAAVFFDTPELLRFQRRLERDVKERGRTAEGVFNQFFKQVQPMHEEYVQPSKQYARWVIQDFEEYEEGLMEVEGFLRVILGLESFERSRSI